MIVRLLIVMPVCARERCRTSPYHFLAKCRKTCLNQGSLVLLYIALFAIWELCLVCVLFCQYQSSEVTCGSVISVGDCVQCTSVVVWWVSGRASLRFTSCTLWLVVCTPAGSCSASRWSSTRGYNRAVVQSSTRLLNGASLYAHQHCISLTSSAWMSVSYQWFMCSSVHDWDWAIVSKLLVVLMKHLKRLMKCSFYQLLNNIGHLCHLVTVSNTESIVWEMIYKTLSFLLMLKSALWHI